MRGSVKFLQQKKKNIYFANSKNNYNTNIMSKHRGGFPEGQSPIVLDTLQITLQYREGKRTKHNPYTKIHTHAETYTNNSKSNTLIH